MKEVLYQLSYVTEWLQRQDSNLRFLAYETKRMTTSILCFNLVSVERIELPPHVPKTRTLPLRYTEKIQQVHFWLLDIKRILIAELNLKLVPHERIELPSSDYKTDVLPFN